MKRKLAVCLCLLLVLSLGLVGCKSETAGPDTGSEKEAETDFPNRPVSIIVGFGPGGGNDVAARIMQPYLEKAFGVPVVIENKPGAGGTIGITAVFNAPADGYTIGSFSSPAYIQNALSDELNLSWTLDDFYHFATVTAEPRGIIVLGDSPYNTFQDLIDDAKARPGEVTQSAIGPISNEVAFHLDIEEQFGVDMNIVLYPDTSAVMTSLYGGFGDFMVGACERYKEDVEKGDIKLLAIHTKERHEYFPDVPTCAELGLDMPLDSASMRGYMVHKDTPKEIIDIIEKVFQEAIRDNPAVAKEFEEKVCKFSWLGGQELETYMREQAELWKEWVPKLEAWAATQ